MQTARYGLLDGLIRARYARETLSMLEFLNTELEVLRYQTRLCRDFDLLDVRRYAYVSTLTNGIGEHLGAWIRQQCKGIRMMNELPLCYTGYRYAWAFIIS